MYFKPFLRSLSLLLFVSFSYLSAQNNDKGSQKPYRVVTADAVTQVTSIASRMSQLKPADLSEQKEIQDARAKIRQPRQKIIPGKGSQGNDVLAIQQANSQRSPSRAPLNVFETAASSSQPTDPAGAVGPNHYIAVTNTAFRIFDKNGNPLTALLAPNPSIFPNGGCCDLTASYDNLADRWVLSFLGNGAQIAVSNGPDPVNDGWTVYNYSPVADYQKLSVWHDGYYMTDNTSGTFHVFERDEMLAGNTGAQLVSFTVPGWQDPGGFDSPQFLNLSHAAAVSGHATMIYMADDSWGSVSQDDHIKLWNVTMDWSDPNNSTVTNPIRLGVDASGNADGTVTPFISTFDGGSFANLTQPGGQAIDALQWIIMNQAQFRKFPTHNSALFNFVVDTDGGAGELAGIRWYELRQTADGQPWTIYQEGTYVAPDGRHAWNASMVMDVQGNIGMGYTSMSGPATPTTVRVSSYYTGQLVASSGTGIMDVTEEVIMEGDANIPGFERYGDYSKIDVDPANDKTFWFVNELMQNGRKNICGVFQLAPNTNDDVGVVSIDAPLDGDLSSSETITVTLFNFGENAASGFDVTYQIDGGAVITEPFVGTLASGASTPFTFATTADLSNEGQSYTIEACTSYTIDEDTSNDCISTNVTHILTNDIAVTALTNPNDGFLGNETITITIENFGSSDQTGFDVSYSIDGGTPVIETVGINVPAQGSISYSFAQTADFSVLQTYSVELCTLLSTDQNMANDCFSTDITSEVVFCDPSGDCSFGDGITVFQLGTINETGISCTTSGYLDLTAISTDLNRLAGNNVHNGVLQTGWFFQQFSIFIDFNGDGDFTDSGELLLDTLELPDFQNDVDLPFSITIPTDANLGSHTMRVRSFDPNGTGTLNDPCSDLEFGKTVDFTVNIIDSSLSTNDFELNDATLSIVSKPNRQFEILLSSTISANQLTFNLFNLLGQQLTYDVLTRDGSGNFSYNLDMSYAASGVYIVKVGRDNNFKTGKLIVK